MAVLTYRDDMPNTTFGSLDSVVIRTGRVYAPLIPSRSLPPSSGGLGGLTGGGSSTRVVGNTLVTTIAPLVPEAATEPPDDEDAPEPAGDSVDEDLNEAIDAAEEDSFRAPGTHIGPELVPEVDITARREPVRASILGPSLGDLPFVTVSAPRPKPAPKRRTPVRRTKPKPARRPRRLPSIKPRLPIFVPALVRLNFAASLAALVLPVAFEVATKLDDAATRSWQEQLGLLPRKDDDDSHDERLGDPESSPARPAGDSPLAEVLITAPRFGERPVASPFGAPNPLPPFAPHPIGVDWIGDPVGLGAFPLPARRPAPKPKPQPRFRSKPIGAPSRALPQADPLAGINPATPNPFLAPSPTPEPAPKPNPQPAPSPTPNDPLPFAPPLGAPGAPIVGAIEPMPGLGPIPLEELDRCNCRRTTKKKKSDRKKRTLCSSGRYKQTATGLSKVATKWFDCETGEARPKPSKPSGVKAVVEKVKKKLPYRGTKLPRWQDVFKPPGRM